jgi:sulfopyruvate decarboxylase TPP-binding subunit
MYEGPAVVAALRSCGVTHVVWIPDSHLGAWESALAPADSPRLVRATREGEAIAIAAGLFLGGARPLVVIQCTGLFEAGDALRNVVYDMELPLALVVGIRSYVAHAAGKSADNCPRFTEPILKAWGVPYTLIDPAKQPVADLESSLRSIYDSRKAGAVALAE